MKRQVITFLCVLAAVAGLFSCDRFDRDEELGHVSQMIFVNAVRNYTSLFLSDPDWYGTDDSLAGHSCLFLDTLDVRFTINDGRNYGNDSVSQIVTLFQVGDSTVLQSEGYRYGSELWTHYYLEEPGLVNGKGLFHIDFYQTGQSQPWAWSELDIPDNPNSYSRYYDSENFVIGYY